MSAIFVRTSTPQAPISTEPGDPARRTTWPITPFVGSPDPDRLIPALHNMGIPVRAENFAMNSENGVVVWELLKSGFGVSMLPEILCDAEPGIEKVLPSLPSLEFPIWLVTHRELQTSRRIRIVFDQLARGLAEAAGKIDDRSGGSSSG